MKSRFVFAASASSSGFASRSGSALASGLTKTKPCQVSIATGIRPSSFRGKSNSRPHRGAERRRAVELVGPAVVAALQGAAVAVLERDRVGAMPADVDEAVQLAVHVAGDHDGHVARLRDDVVAGARELLLGPDERPGAPEDALELEGVHRGVGVPARRDRPALGEGLVDAAELEVGLVDRAHGAPFGGDQPSDRARAGRAAGAGAPSPSMLVRNHSRVKLRIAQSRSSI